MSRALVCYGFWITRPSILRITFVVLLHCRALVRGSTISATSRRFQRRQRARTRFCWYLLKKEIGLCRNRKLLDAFQQITSATPTSQIQRIPKPFKGPSNKLRQGLAPLPLVKDDKGTFCRTADDTLTAGFHSLARWKEEEGPRTKNNGNNGEATLSTSDNMTHRLRLRKSLCFVNSSLLAAK